jgi:hypothetical protein
MVLELRDGAAEAAADRASTATVTTTIAMSLPTASLLVVMVCSALKDAAAAHLFHVRATRCVAVSRSTLARRKPFVSGVGASRPAPLTPPDRLALFDALELWRHEHLTGRLPRLPRRIEELRHLLARDLAR